MASHLSAHCSMLAFLAEGQRLFCHSFFVDAGGGVNLDLYIRCGVDIDRVVDTKHDGRLPEIARAYIPAQLQLLEGIITYTT